MWFENGSDQDARFDSPIMCQKAEERARKMGEGNYVASNGWKKGNNTGFKRTRGEQKDADFTELAKYRMLKISSDYHPYNVYKRMRLEFSIAPWLSTLNYQRTNMPNGVKRLKNALLLCAVIQYMFVQ